MIEPLSTPPALNVAAASPPDNAGNQAVQAFQAMLIKDILAHSQAKHDSHDMGATLSQDMFAEQISQQLASCDLFGLNQALLESLHINTANTQDPAKSVDAKLSGGVLL